MKSQPIKKDKSSEVKSKIEKLESEIVKLQTQNNSLKEQISQHICPTQIISLPNGLPSDWKEKLAELELWKETFDNQTPEVVEEELKIQDNLLVMRDKELARNQEKVQAYRKMRDSAHETMIEQKRRTDIFIKKLTELGIDVKDLLGLKKEEIVQESPIIQNINSWWNNLTK